MNTVARSPHGNLPAVGAAGRSEGAGVIVGTRRECVAALGSVHRTRAFLVARAKRDMNAPRVYGAPNDGNDSVRIRDDSLELIRRIRCKDPENGKTLIFLTNNMSLTATTIAAL